MAGKRKSVAPGHRLGLLTLLENVETNNHAQAHAKEQYECGREKLYANTSLK